MKHITANVYSFTGLLVGRVYMIKDADGLTLIDTGISMAAPRILAQLSAAGYQPGDVRRILITHAHPDHIGGLPALKEATGAEVIIGAVEAPYMRGEAIMPVAPRESLSGISRLMAMEPRTLSPQPFDRTAADGEVLTEVMGGLQAIHTPGHTSGHVSFWQPEKRIIFCGDVIMNMVGLTLPFAAATPDMNENRRSIQKLAALNPDIACFGHGNPLMSETTARIHEFAGKVGAG